MLSTSFMAQAPGGIDAFTHRGLPVDRLIVEAEQPSFFTRVA
jgi:hypothetical protein